MKSPTQVPIDPLYIAAAARVTAETAEQMAQNDVNQEKLAIKECASTMLRDFDLEKSPEAENYIERIVEAYADRYDPTQWSGLLPYFIQGMMTHLDARLACTYLLEYGIKPSEVAPDLTGLKVNAVMTVLNIWSNLKETYEHRLFNSICSEVIPDYYAHQEAHTKRKEAADKEAQKEDLEKNSREFFESQGVRAHFFESPEAMAEHFKGNDD